MNGNLKKAATVGVAGLVAAASMAAPALADETAVTPDEQARQAVDEAQRAVPGPASSRPSRPSRTRRPD